VNEIVYDYVNGDENVNDNGNGYFDLGTVED